MFKTTRRFLLLLAVAIGASPLLASEPIKVGVTTGPHAEILEVVREEAATLGLSLRIVEFTDYVQPNAALAAGDIDANSYQHQPYLDASNVDRRYDLVSIGRTFAAPIGLYSRRFESLAALPERAQVAIPNDPTNGSRALLLLQSQGVIELAADAGLRASPLDVVANPRRLRFIELDAAQLPRSLPDVDLAAVNTNYAIEAGLNPVTDALVREAVDSPYVNVLAVRAVDRERPELATLLRAYHSERVKQFILDRYQGSLVPAW